MGAFVLGVLVGWLIAWVYYTFWIKPNLTGDCSAFEEELDLKNKQISSLQSQISSSTQKTESTNSSTKQTAAVSKESTIETSSSKKPIRKKPSQSNKKTVTSTNKKASNVKNTKTKKVESKSPAKKTSQTRKSKAGGDDFTKISGIGPSMSAKLKSIGIDTFKKLAATDDDILRKKLEEAGARMNNNKDVMDSWNEQATLAAKGEFSALKKMQEALKK